MTDAVTLGVQSNYKYNASRFSNKGHFLLIDL